MIIVEQPVSQRLDRVINDVCELLHNKSADARQRAQRWIAHVLNDANDRRKWWFLERTAQTTLAVGQDIVDLSGDIDKVVGLFAPKRLTAWPLPRLVELRQTAIEEGTANAGTPGRYALEHLDEDTIRVHLWPAPGGSNAVFTANAGTDLATLASTATLTTGDPVRVLSDGALPAPLLASTLYYAIVIDSTTLKFATTAALASAGTAVDLTDAGTGTHTLAWNLTPFGTAFTRPMDLEIVPPNWETLVLNGVIGLFGVHFDRDALTAEPKEFENRYERALLRNRSPSYDVEHISLWDDDPDPTETASANSASGTAVSAIMPASLTGIGYVTIETGDYPLVVQ